MKKILALAAVAALTAGVSAYAANPFSDVTPDDWAFQAVSDLSAQGVVEGYPDGTFKGERNMTRYELAQIVARLMAKEDQLNAEQQATLNKLAGEYADELANLGVRVANLEKKVGNISWSGDARMQYQHHKDIDLKDGKIQSTDNADGWTGRMRINVSGQVNDQVSVEGRLATNMYFKDADTDDGKTTMDKIHVVYQPTDAFSIDLGRTSAGLSQTGIFMDDDGQYDGIVAAYDNGKFNLSAGYGRVGGGYEIDEDTSLDYHDYENWFVKAGTKVGDKVDLSAFYTKYASKSASKDLAAELNKVPGLKSEAANVAVWGVGAGVDLGGGFVLDGDYIKHADKLTDKAAMWTAGLTYGEVDTDKVGSWSLGVHYVDADRLAYLGGVSAWDMTDHLDYSLLAGMKFWQAKAGVALQKNVELDAYYYFAGKAKENKNIFGDPDDTWGIELNYAF